MRSPRARARGDRSAAAETRAATDRDDLADEPQQPRHRIAGQHQPIPAHRPRPALGVNRRDRRSGREGGRPRVYHLAALPAGRLWVAVDWRGPARCRGPDRLAPPRGGRGPVDLPGRPRGGRSGAAVGHHQDRHRHARSTRSCSRPPAAHSSSYGCATTTTSRRQPRMRSGRSGVPGPDFPKAVATCDGSHPLANVLVTCLRPGTRLARHPGAAELLDDRRAEGGQVRGGTADDELPIDDDLLVDDLGAGVA